MPCSWNVQLSEITRSEVSNNAVIKQHPYLVHTLPCSCRGGSTYGPNRHRPPLLTDKSSKFSLFYVIFGLFSGYISHPAPPFLHILDPPLSWNVQLGENTRSEVSNNSSSLDLHEICIQFFNFQHQIDRLMIPKVRSSNPLLAVCCVLVQGTLLLLAPLDPGQMQGCSQPSQSQVGKSPLSSFCPQILIDVSYFSSNFTYFLPHFGPPGGRVAHPGRHWLRHWPDV